MSPTNEVYLGDGVYAKFDGNGIEVYTDRSREDEKEIPDNQFNQIRHYIYFEPEVLRALSDFCQRMNDERVTTTEIPTDKCSHIRSDGGSWCIFCDSEMPDDMEVDDAKP